MTHSLEVKTVYNYPEYVVDNEWFIDPGGQKNHATIIVNVFGEKLSQSTNLVLKLRTRDKTHKTFEYVNNNDIEWVKFLTNDGKFTINQQTGVCVIKYQLKKISRRVGNAAFYWNISVKNGKKNWESVETIPIFIRTKMNKNKRKAASCSEQLAVYNNTLLMLTKRRKVYAKRIEELTYELSDEKNINWLYDYSKMNCTSDDQTDALDLDEDEDVLLYNSTDSTMNCTSDDQTDVLDLDEDLDVLLYNSTDSTMNCTSDDQTDVLDLDKDIINVLLYNSTDSTMNCNSYDPTYLVGWRNPSLKCYLPLPTSGAKKEKGAHSKEEMTTAHRTENFSKLESNKA